MLIVETMVVYPPSPYFQVLNVSGCSRGTRDARRRSCRAFPFARSASRLLSVSAVLVLASVSPVETQGRTTANFRTGNLFVELLHSSSALATRGEATLKMFFCTGICYQVAVSLRFTAIRRENFRRSQSTFLP